MACARVATGVALQAGKAACDARTAASTWATSKTGTTGTVVASSASSNGWRMATTARSRPMLLRRDAPNMSTGSGMAGCGVRRNGEESKTSMPTDSSASWFTKEELAPFSSKRRTR